MLLTHCTGPSITGLSLRDHLSAPCIGMPLDVYLGRKKPVVPLLVEVPDWSAAI